MYFLTLLTISSIPKWFIFQYISDVQVSCIKHVDRYIPPLWVMCLESVAHLLVMLNFSSNFLIYCSVSNQFKSALFKVCNCLSRPSSATSEASDYHNLKTNTLIPSPSDITGSTAHEMVELSILNNIAVKTFVVQQTFTKENYTEMQINRV